MTVAANLAHAVASLRQGRADQAEALCREILSQQPHHAEAMHLLGILAVQRGNPAFAVECLRKSVKSSSNNAFAHGNLGNALCALKQPAEALESYRRALALMPDFAGTWYSQGNALMDLQRFAEARASFDRAIELQSNYPEAHNNLGNAQLALGDPQGALASYRRAVDLRPDFTLAIGNCVKVLMDLNRYPESLVFCDKLVRMLPDDLEGLCHRGHCLLQVDRSLDALASFDRAVSLAPGSVEALYGHGTVLRVLKRSAEALDDFDRALALAPDSVDILYRRGEVLRDLQRPQEAAVAFAKVLQLAPGRKFALGNLMHARLSVCDWTDYEQNVADALDAVATGKRVYLPGPFLSVANSAEAQWQCAQIFAARKKRIAPARLWTGQTYSHDRIRVAYVSADFREHPVSQLLVGVLEHHDRRRFEITGMSLSPEHTTPLGRRVKHAFDRFIDGTRMSDLEVASMLRELEIDIAVDLMGLTGNGRPEIFSHRPAPVQVSYLGFTATTASSDLDYLIADSVVAPPAEQRFYSERIVHLPYCYQPSDDRRPIAAETPTREHCGLPQGGFVFCCFNTHYKISPRLFAVWMRLLREVPDSMLWLLVGSAETVRNLQRAALEHTVSPERLVFAPRLADPAQHLARYRLADLFLDTLPFNAHATASDALWAGLPLLTCRGGSFAGRVAASLLTALGVPELITESVEEYQARALELAASPATLLDLRARVHGNRSTHPLFATARYTGHLEAAFETMLESRRRSEPPAPFSVPPRPVT